MLRREKRPTTIKVVQEAANALLSRRIPPSPPVSISWVGRWLQLNRAKEEAMRKSREALQPAQVEVTHHEEPIAVDDGDDDDGDDYDEEEEDDDDASSESENGDQVLVPTTANPPNPLLSNPNPLSNLLSNPNSLSNPDPPSNSLNNPASEQLIDRAAQALTAI